MTEKEKTEFYIATCKCCLLADVMKTCPSCRFNVGRAEKQKPIDSIPLSIPIDVNMFAVVEQQ